MTKSSSVTPTKPDERTPLLLLIGQGFFIGAALTLLYMTANTLFLLNFGPETLPYLYLTSGLVISLASYGFAELQKRLALSGVAVMTLALFSGIFFAVRLGLTPGTVKWISFGLMLCFSLMTLMTSIVLGAQAGRLFDVRQMKRLYPLVLASQILAVVIGGSTVSLLVRLLGGFENLLFLSGAGILAALIFLTLTLRRYGPALAQIKKTSAGKESKSLPQLLKKRYVQLIFGYQILSAVGTQLAIFVLLSIVDVTFTTPEALTRFFGGLLAAGTLSTLLFLLFVAGRLLNRFGLLIGLTANPGVVTAVMVAIALAGLIGGPGSAIFFWLIVAARFFDFVLTTGMTDTAVKATYQALPSDERVGVQTAVEGIGNPVAMGLAGVVLLIFNSFSGLTLVHNVFFTLAVCGLWSAAAVLAYRDYASVLTKSLSRRVLNEAELTLDDSSSLAVVENLLRSSDISQVRLALDTLAQNDHPSLDERLINLLDHPDPEVRFEASARVERHKAGSALSKVTARLQVEENAMVKGQAVRTLCALAEADAVETAAALMDDPSPEIRLGAMVGMLRYGGIIGVLAAGERLTELEHASDPAQRAFVARVIGQVESPTFYKPLLGLLKAENLEERKAALVAAGQVGHPRLLPLVIDNLTSAPVRSAAMSALTASGEKLLPIVEKALNGEAAYPEGAVVRLVRACGQIKGERVIALLKRHLNHPDDDAQYEVLHALQRCGYRAGESEQAEVNRILRGEVEQGARILLARQSLGEDEVAAMLLAALDYELSQAVKRIMLLLSFIHDSRAILRARERLEHGSAGEKALALETLDVMLPGEQKALVFPLLDPTLTPAKRLQGLGKSFTLSGYDRQACLRHIIGEARLWPHGWTRACAIYVAAKLDDNSLAGIIEEAIGSSESSIRETAAWALHTLAPEAYEGHAAKLAADPDPQVARVAARIAARLAAHLAS